MNNTVEVYAIFDTIDHHIIIIEDYSNETTYVIDDGENGVDIRITENIYDIIRELLEYKTIHFIHENAFEILFEFLDDDYLEDFPKAQRLYNKLEELWEALQ
jgi:hemerythrin